MSEAELDRVMDAVRMAGAPSDFIEPSQAANDNHVAWPFIPFPEYDDPAHSSPTPIAGCSQNVDVLGLLFGRLVDIAQA
jgi:hypothetical protein